MACIAYISFDHVPAPKGASTHIEAFVRGLANEFGAVDLVTVSGSGGPTGPVERWRGVRQWELPALGTSLVERALCFGGFLTRWLAVREYEVIHFRSIFEGLPIIRGGKGASLVFEVNGLPSIELKYRYPGSEDDRELMRKLEAQERACIRAADSVITPSGVTREFLLGARGAVPEKTTVIPNGADTVMFRPSETKRGDIWKLLYFGTLSTWQGVDVAIRAIALAPKTTLTVLGTGSRGRMNALARLTEKLNIAERVTVRASVSQTELASEVAECNAVMAPLLWNDRNVLQGCCPLKVLEGMAAGRPVIASDLEVVRELGRHEEHLLLVKAGSVEALAAASERLRRDAALAEKLAANGRRWVEERFTWELAVKRLLAVYGRLMACRGQPPESRAVSVPE